MPEKSLNFSFMSLDKTWIKLGKNCLTLYLLFNFNYIFIMNKTTSNFNVVFFYTLYDLPVYCCVWDAILKITDHMTIYVNVVTIILFSAFNANIR